MVTADKLKGKKNSGAVILWEEFSWHGLGPVVPLEEVILIDRSPLSYDEAFPC